MGERALPGLRVLDLADEEASFGSRLLADMGTEVIKVEKPGGDASRWKPPFHGNEPHPEQSLSFWYNNAGKLGITLDLESAEGRDILRRLVAKSDVVVETFPPGYLERLGIGYHTFSDLNPGLIMVSVTGFGQSGPHRQYHSDDIVAAAAGGQMYVCGAPDTPPLKPYGEQAYYTASLFAAVGILLAVRERRKSGKGQHIDISLQEAATATLEHVMVNYFYRGIVSRRQGSRHWNGSFAILPCKDGHVSMSVFIEWDTVVALLDRDGMAGDLKDAKWHDEAYRTEHSDDIIQTVSRWTATRTRDELFELAQSLRLPWAPVAAPEDVASSPQLEARDFFVPVLHPEAKGYFPYPGMPGKFSQSPCRTERRAPHIGEHNYLVYPMRLGFSEAEVEGLSSRGII